MRILNGIAATLTLGALLLTGCNNGGSDTPSPTPGTTTANSGTPAGAKTINIAWAQWDPSNYLEKLSEDFTKENPGITVKVTQIPWESFADKITTGVWTGKSDEYDLIVGDSQWLGRGAVEGHYVDLTDWSKTNVPWDEIAPAAQTFYCKYNDKVYAVPCEADATGFVYRKDLFESPTEKAAFKAKYKYELAPPKTWDQFRDIAEFFTRPDKNMSGTALFYQGSGYDGITMGFMQVLWAYGGDLHDSAGKVEGVINSPDSVAALKFYCQDLKAFTPKGSENYYFNDTLKAFTSGQVAMAMDWYTFFPALIEKSKNQYADQTGFFVIPAGKKGQFVSLGGQGISVSAYSKQQDLAKQFLAWFSKRETQAKWAKLGGLTCNQKVLATDDFLKAKPYNPAFSESVPFLKDFYNNPAYADLLKTTQTDWNNVVTGTMTPQQSMDDIAKKHTDILKKAKLLQ